VSSLVQLVNRHVTNDDIILVGHSGGGTLAMLMAEKLDRVSTVITLAANLQVHRWADFHQYSRLQGSLNPNQRAPLPESVRQVHFYSPYDSVIKAEWIQAFSAKQQNVTLVELPVQGHDQAWNAFHSAFESVLSEIMTKVSGANIE